MKPNFIIKKKVNNIIRQTTLQIHYSLGLPLVIELKNQIGDEQSIHYRNNTFKTYSKL